MFNSYMSYDQFVFNTAKKLVSYLKGWLALSSHLCRFSSCVQWSRVNSISPCTHSVRNSINMLRNWTSWWNESSRLLCITWQLHDRSERKRREKRLNVLHMYTNTMYNTQRQRQRQEKMEQKQWTLEWDYDYRSTQKLTICTNEHNLILIVSDWTDSSILWVYLHGQE